MIKRCLLCFMGMILSLPLSGCWNYRSLDQMNIVVGIGVDFNEEKNLFEVSYEVVNMSGADKKGSIVGKTIHSEGKTIFDAARNTKRKEADKLYFGNSNILVISQNLARDTGLLGITDWFLRDAEGREALYVAISQEETASEILERPQDMEGIMSVNIFDIINEDYKVTGSSINTKLYEVYNSLYSPRVSTFLPVLHKVKSNHEQEEGITELNGLALIKGDKLIGFLSPEQSRYVILLENKLKDGIFTLSMTGPESNDISLEVFRSQSKKSYSYKNGKIVVKIKTRTRVVIGENRSNLDTQNKKVIKQIEEAASQKIESNIKSLIAELQDKYHTDALGFGEMIYRKDLKLWKKLSPWWDTIYPEIEVQVNSKVEVINTGFLK